MDKLREKVAEQYGIALYKQYSEKQAAGILAKDVGTLKRWRAQRKIPHIRLGDSVRYFGFHLVDVLIRGTRDEGTAEVEVINPKGNPGGSWQSTGIESSGSASIGLPDEQTVQPTTDAGSTGDRSGAFRLARRTLRPPSQS